MMKKTLVALAAVAVTGGAFAQSVLTGDIGYGYGSSNSAASGTANGMGLTDAGIYWAMTEDIEGVGKLGANLAIDMSGVAAAYGQAVYVGDETMSLTLASGVKISMGAAKGADYLSAGIASAGSGYNQTLDNVVFTSRTFTDDLKITLPVADTIKVSLTAREAGGGSGGGAASTGVGTQRDSTFSVDYSSSGLVANAGYRVYDGTSSTSTSIASSLTRASASYDLGVAKIGAGFVTTVYGYGNTRTDTLAGITVPVTGALTLGAQIGYRAKSGNATSTLNTNLGGTIVSASYTLSKRTSILASYMTYDPTTTTTLGYTSQTTAYAAKLYSTF